MTRTKTLRALQIIAIVFFSATLCNAQGTRPEGEKQLAREIYKEMIEIQSGFTTGATTPIAEAAAARLKAAGFPEADIFVGGAIPTKQT